jgi:hypothetical protein
MDEAVWEENAEGLAPPTVEVGGATPAGLVLSGVAHSPQNFCVAVTGVPHAGHKSGRGLAHSPQNF